MTGLSELYVIFKKHPRISTDSRNIIPDSIFFSLKGPSFDGNAFAEMALESKAAYAVIDDPSKQKDEKYLLVDNGLQALQQLANHHRRQLNIPFLAITGSNGKTTTKELIRNVLSKKFRTVATKGNLNNHIGVPLTILSIPVDCEFAVIEMGANHLHEIETYCRIAEPDYGLITNVGKAHLEGFGGFEGVKRGKGELYEWIAKNGKGIFINGDNTHLVAMSERNMFREIVTYGSEKKNFCIGTLVEQQPFLKIKWECKSSSGEINSQLPGAYNFENILSAICVGNYFEVNATEIGDAIEKYVPDNSRSQIVKKSNNTIILDAYNANPTSMEAALDNFSKISAQRKVIFIGEMAELGDESIGEHERIVSLIRKKSFDKIILVGEKFGKFSKDTSGLYFEDSEKASAWLRNNPIENSYILIKGSRSTKMEKILDAL